MPWEIDSDLQSSVTSWVRATLSTDQENATRPKRPHRACTKRRQRSSPRLTPTSGNLQLREETLHELDYRNWRNSQKTKRGTMEREESLDIDEQEALQAHQQTNPDRGRGGRRPGRPPGRGRGLSRGAGRQRGLQTRSATTTPGTFAPARAKSQPRSRSQSVEQPMSLPSWTKSLLKPKSDITIDMAYLKFCKPSVRLMKPQDVKQTGAFTSQAQVLYEMLNKSLAGYIPMRLKKDYTEDAATPKKTREVPEEFRYVEESLDILPAEYAAFIKPTVDQVHTMAEFNAHVQAHERQWSYTTVAPLLNLVLMWQKPREIKLLNIESCAIEPRELRLHRPTGEPLDDDTQLETSEPSTTHTVPQATITRMVDLSLGLTLSLKDEEIVDAAFATMKDNEQSLHQSLSYNSGVPTWITFELKKTIATRPPEVQLAIWAAAGLKKSQHHGWDTSMPVPGIVISGSEWQCYQFLENKKNLIMMGPIRIGSTSTIQGVYEILHKLEILVRWGRNQYKTWFNNKILGWCCTRSGRKGFPLSSDKESDDGQLSGGQMADQTSKLEAD